jgi:hypothetical protein
LPVDGGVPDLAVDSPLTRGDLRAILFVERRKMPTEHELLYDLVKEIADGKWDGGISATALRERAYLIVYGEHTRTTYEGHLYSDEYAS